MTTSYTLITGATSGIGLELAKVFANHGHNLILVSRNWDKLKTTENELKSAYPKIQTFLIVADLSKPENAQRVFDQTQEAGLKVQVLVNNAGFGSNGEFTKLDLNQELAQIQLNVTSLVNLTGLYLPLMVAEKSGKILNVASTAAFLPGPLMAVYYATKAFVYSFSSAISKEVEKKGVLVSVLCPGATKTNFDKTANLTNSRLFTIAPMMTAERVAELAYNGLVKRKRVIVTGFSNWMLTLGLRFLPLGLILNTTMYVNQSPNEND